MNTKGIKRVEWIDVTKGIGIICVILGHLGVEKIDRVVYTFHMPLFFIISGYLLRVDTSWKNFIKQKSKRLLLPYYISGGIICALVFFADILRGMWTFILSDMYSVVGGVLYGTCAGSFDKIEGIGALWFLWALFLSCTIVKLFSSCRYGYIYICTLAVISYVSSLWIILPFSIQPAMTAAVFVFMGWNLQKIDLEAKLNNIYLFVLGILILFIEVILDIRVDIASNTYNYGVISAIGAVCICYSVVLVAKKISEKKSILKEQLAILGKYSLFILCIHKIEMRVFPWSIVLLLLQNIGAEKSFYFVVLISRLIGYYICFMLYAKMKDRKKSL